MKKVVTWELQTKMVATKELQTKVEGLNWPEIISINGGGWKQKNRPCFFGQNSHVAVSIDNLCKGFKNLYKCKKISKKNK